MNAKQTFDQLRILPCAKREQDIESAKTAYDRRLEQIKQLERDLSSVDPSKARRPRRTINPTKDVIDAVAPQDEIFTFDDLVKAVSESQYPPPETRNLRNTLRLMTKSADRFKEVFNPKSRLIKRYARLHVEAQEPLQPLAKTVMDALEQNNAPMRPIDICVWLIENDMALGGDPAAAVGDVNRVLKSRPGQFREADKGYWRVATPVKNRR